MPIFSKEFDHLSCSPERRQPGPAHEPFMLRQNPIVQALFGKKPGTVLQHTGVERHIVANDTKPTGTKSDRSTKLARILHRARIKNIHV